MINGIWKLLLIDWFKELGVPLQMIPHLKALRCGYILQPDAARWIMVCLYKIFFFLNMYHLFLEGSVGTANIHYPAAMRSITLPCTVEILLQKPGIYNPFYFLLFQTEDQADWNHVIWGPPVTIERWNHLKEGLIWGNMSKYDERWWHVM